ncbi:MAG: TIGR02587 family membrane protein [Microcoleus sp. PH2017_01_SCD_O_A]|uniref:TIGR02587 family membrane protein n=1 Tax=unclassified Microcoleus TaxID=2642155 RepID=UPI001DA43F88|nr:MULTISPECIES: TIGR02587 family membrane protein [unclassified Microcoleus]MCC3430725.1 TIGR02587 family membrane protein [Microcoleus sp. PH2017_04_SCI_O_A]MCC3469144.1 TIGR02587 family membrane protein [Microcoleus sp. PH2017_06_SFM_O_A]MCC3502594.1 TIGR02587 family membrane protein [Microcoleus sp. PH2017_19_SFW_U_A]TAE12495.1 MAG: TIGR02587 family membrane protein [Oscillatoriales cyanobacterium]MCC3424893.1 TIGR02587 family membrane protein [Microcoleus sp. PH2017_01_SCD_O_A]
MNKSKRRKNQWSNELNDIIRGASGGFLFGIPLLYTMEVWWIGSSTKPAQMSIAIITTFIVVFLLTRTEGFRKTKDIRWRDAAIDTVEAIAIGIVCAAVILFLLREITPDTPLQQALGKIIFEGLPFALGVALASGFLSGDRYQSSDSDSEPMINPTLADIGATLIGAMIIAFNIAPTDEIPMLAAAISPPWQLAIIAASLLISYGIVFAADFTSQAKRQQQRGIFQRPLSETVMAYLVSLVASAFMLFFFHKLSFDDPWSVWLGYTLVLGLPATVGGAAGRLAV